MSTTDRRDAFPWAALLWSLMAVHAVADAGSDSAASGIAPAVEAVASKAASTGRTEQAQTVVPKGPFAHEECLQCHTERDPALVARWRDGPHGKSAQCTACHGDRHGDLPAVRQDRVCTGCHGGAVAHSYSTSKHGVLVRIGRPDWTLPLRRGNYRSPGCAYCHLHAQDHADTMDPTRGPAVREWVCGACHAPRYVTEQLVAGDRSMDVARLKVREAEELAARHPEGAGAVGGHLESVGRHLANVRFGVGHQSPDYQWWHGQAALDGDLIGLRGAVEGARRAQGRRGD